MKRLLDMVIGASLLLLLSPVLGAIAVLIRCSMGRPLFFIQPRPGKGGRIFQLMKFRTMSTAQETDPKSPDGFPRVTPVGKILRRTSLDELPQLWNVLRGDMSLIGPRPLLVEYLPLYSDEQNRRHEVRPGITGWAQVNGRNAISWEEKFLLDVWYVDHQCFWLDMKILFLTFRRVLGCSNINAQGEVTMPKFTGSKPRNSG
jgi:lipopolysaccharide/colanic/teichoic acid biosynthesis glycosyltransferase